MIAFSRRRTRSPWLSFYGEGYLSTGKAIFLRGRLSFYGEGYLSTEKAIFLRRRLSFYGEGNPGGMLVVLTEAVPRISYRERAVLLGRNLNIERLAVMFRRRGSRLSLRRIY